MPSEQDRIAALRGRVTPNRGDLTGLQAQAGSAGARQADDGLDLLIDLTTPSAPRYFDGEGRETDQWGNPLGSVAAMAADPKSPAMSAMTSTTVDQDQDRLIERIIDRFAAAMSPLHDEVVGLVEAVHDLMKRVEALEVRLGGEQGEESAADGIDGEH